MARRTEPTEFDKILETNYVNMWLLAERGWKLSQMPIPDPPEDTDG